MEKDDLEILYQETILDHFKNPRGMKKCEHCTAEKQGYNPLCGDKVDMSVRINEDNTIEDMQVLSQGCAISVASGSMLAELLPGKNITEVREISDAFFEMMQGKPMPDEIDYGDLDTLEGVNKFHSRVKCALLAWKTLKEILIDWEKEKASK